MASKIFIDANVLLDFTLKREQYTSAKIILERIVEGSFQGYISTSVVHTCAYWLDKSYGSKTAKTIILELLNYIEVIDCRHDNVVNALNAAMTDIEDALQYYTALHHKLDCLVTRDLGFHNVAMPSLPIYFPTEFIELFIE